MSGCSSNSYNPPPDTTPPSAPTGLTATAVSTSQINLSWTASTDNVGVTGYKVERCQGAACSSFVQVATPTTTTFSDTGLTGSTSYSYRVRATDAAGNLSTFSNTSSATTTTGPISVSITPVRGGATVSQSVNFTASLQNDASAAGVTWTTSGGTFSSQGKTTATFVAPNSTGNVTITATSIADVTKSASAILAVTDLTGVTTYHNDLSRDGVNSHEFALTPSSVKTATFGRLFSCTVDGAIYAQPLWVANLTISTTKHNVIFVATMHNSVYAFDADDNANPCVVLWHANLIDAAHGAVGAEASVNGTLLGNGFGDIQPEVGVTGTPVIDPATNIMYVVSKSVNGSTQFFQRLHALDLTTGNEKLNSNKPVLISASVTGDGDGSSGGNVAFDPRNEHQRSGLALVNGVVYVAWASHEDHDPYHGWLIGFNASTLAQVPNGVFNTTPNAVASFPYSRGGIWMAGGAPASDVGHNLYLITGNGTYNGSSNFSDSILRFDTSAGLTLHDWFTPKDQDVLDASDFDLGSGGAVVLVDLPAPAPFPHLLIGGGKAGSGNTGEVYVLNRDNMGLFTPNDSGILQQFPLGSHIFATAAFWQNRLYVAGEGGPLTAFTFNQTTGLFTNTSTPVQSPTSYGFPGATPSVSSNGTTNGIVWAIDSSQYCTPPQPNGCGAAVLHAYDATNVHNELWTSGQIAADKAGLAVKFTVPTVANGKVYIGTRGNDGGAGTSSILGELDVYGLKPN